MENIEQRFGPGNKLSVIGLGYVGMPLAIAFAKKLPVIGFDINEEKIALYQLGYDPTNEVGDEAVREATVDFTSDEKKLNDAIFHIVAVPTPINLDKTPDLSPIIGASEIVGRHLRQGATVVFESTVYPGVTEDICIPILEEASGLICGQDFDVGYSPERINPGDKVNTLENIVKIVAGTDEQSTEKIAEVYELVIKAGVFRAGSIKVAEAAKVVENSQRDINIAFMNELAMVFDRMDIDTNEVVAAMNTKWNALGFTPGLVGGHCIGVDPYYFIYEAEKLGYHSQIILSGRKINDGMGKFVAEAIIRELVLADRNVKRARIVILGLTFKENCPDTRNTKVIDIVRALEAYGVEPVIVDPVADVEETKREYGIELSDLSTIKDADCLVFAVAHDLYRTWGTEELSKLCGDRSSGAKIVIDVKGIFDKKMLRSEGFRYWSL